MSSVKHQMHPKPLPGDSLRAHVDAAVRQVRYLGLYRSCGIKLAGLGRVLYGSFAFAVKRDAQALFPKVGARRREFRAVMGPDAIVFVRVK